MFQGNPLTGLLFLVGILTNSRTAVFYTVLGALLPIPLAILLGIDAETLNMGFTGYNGVLCAIALENRTWKVFVWASCPVLLFVILQIIGMNSGITTLTAPFVVSVWINGNTKGSEWQNNKVNNSHTINIILNIKTERQMKTRIMLLTISVLFAVSCTNNRQNKKTCNETADSIPFVVKGKVIMEHEVRSFTTEEDTLDYWIYDRDGKLDSRYKEITKENVLPYPRIC